MDPSSPSDRIVLRDMELPCRVGVEAPESERPQPLRLRLAIELDLQDAGRSDQLENTVDYGWLAETTRHVLEQGPFRLLEAVALRIVETLLEDKRIRAAEVGITKSLPPLGPEIGPIWVHLRRERGELR